MERNGRQIALELDDPSAPNTPRGFACGAEPTINYRDQSLTGQPNAPWLASITVTAEPGLLFRSPLRKGNGTMPSAVKPYIDYLARVAIDFRDYSLLRRLLTTRCASLYRSDLS